MAPPGQLDQPDVDTGTPAVVLKLDQNVFHHGGLGVIRSLGRLGVPVYAVHEESLTPASRSRYLRGGWVWRPDPEDVARLIDGLNQLAERLERPAVLIPTDDAGALFLAEHGDGLRDRFLFPRQQAHLPRLVAGKYSLFQLCRMLGVPAAETVLARSMAEADAFVAGFGLPVIAKLASPWRSQRGPRQRSTSIIHTSEELRAVWHRCAAAGTELLLQEYVPGGPGHDWIFHGYCDESSTCRPAFTGVKTRSYPSQAGLTSMGRVQFNQRLVEQVQELLRTLSYRGTMDLDLRFDPRDQTYKLLDFNPRIGAQFRLFRDTAGVDVAVAAHLDLTGRPIPDGARPVQRTFFVENYDPISALGHIRRGELTLGGWLRSLREVDELAWFARDDLAPFGLMCLRLGWRVLQRPLRHRWPGTARPGPADPQFRRGRAAIAGHPLPARPRPATPSDSGHLGVHT